MTDDVAAEAPEVEAAESGDEPERPRRRRRRRRRRGSGEREVTRSVEPEDDFGGPELEEPAGEIEDEAAPPRRAPREAAEREEGEGRAERRPRRRRRRRSGERPASAEREPVESADVFDAAEEEPFEAEPVVPAMNYDNIPTWEEAISYLLKPAGDSRRDNGGYRGGPRRR